MDYKELLINMRINKQLKGRMAGIITVFPNSGRIYRQKKPFDYIMSIDSAFIHFQGLRGLAKKLDSSLDFDVRIADLKKYVLNKKAVAVEITIYTKDGFYLPITLGFAKKYFNDSRTSLEEILKKLEAQGVKEYQASNVFNDEE